MFTSDIRHKEGRNLVVPDWLSRPPGVPIGKAYDMSEEFEGEEDDDKGKISYICPELTMAALEEVAFHTLTPQAIAQAQADCPDDAAHKSGQMPRNVRVADVDMSGSKVFCEVSDIGNPRPLIPVSQRNLVVNLFHHLDHPSVKETVRRTSKEYYWPGLKKEVSGFVRSCHPCQVAKQSPTVNPGTGDFPVPDKRFSHIHLDIVGPFVSSNGYKYILTCYDRCSRWTEAYPLVRDSSEQVCRGFKEWVARYG